MRKITFEYQKDWGEHNLIKETIEFGVWEDDIQKEYEEWVWEFIADQVCWYEED